VGISTDGLASDAAAPDEGGEGVALAPPDDDPAPEQPATTRTTAAAPATTALDAPQRRFGQLLM